MCADNPSDFPARVPRGLGEKLVRFFRFAEVEQGVGKIVARERIFGAKFDRFT